MLNTRQNTNIKYNKRVRIKNKVKFYGTIGTLLYILAAAYVILNINQFTILYK